METTMHVIQYDSLVTLPNRPNTCKIYNTCYKKNMSENNIVIVEPMDAKTVVVSLFFRKGAEEFDQNLTEVARGMQRERVSGYLLRGCIIMQGCFIQPKEFRNNQSSFKGITKILIVSTEPSTQSLENNPVQVTDKTKIIVQSIRRGSELENENNNILAGLDDTVRELQEVLNYPFQYPKCFDHLGLDCPKGILLQGAPGVGKTLLVKRVTSQWNAQLITLNGTDVFGPHPGESEENLRKTFKIARNASQHGPCVLFIDELDALCPKRGSSGNEQESRIVAQLLTLLDGLESRGQLIIIGATNRPNAIDPALRRPGRLDREVVIGVPNAIQRLSILKAHTQSLKLSDEVDLAHVAELTLGYVGADIASLCREAAFVALKRMINHSNNGNRDSLSVEKTLKDSEDNVGEITMADFQLALCYIVPSMYRGLEGKVGWNPVSWEDIGGLQDVKQALKQTIEWPLKHPEAFTRLGLKRPRGVLLYGPQGCCKTTLVLAAATSCKCTFLALSCAQLYSPYVGDAERKIREVFTKARATAPSVLFLDELDALVGKRSEMKGTGVEARLLSTLLNEMDGVGTLANIYQSAERNNKPLTQGNNREQLMRNDCGSAHLENEEASGNVRPHGIAQFQTERDWH